MNVQNNKEVLTLDGIQSHVFYCEHCNRSNMLSILSGEDTFKCRSCGEKSSMKHTVSRTGRFSNDWSMDALRAMSPMSAPFVGGRELIQEASGFNNGGRMMPDFSSIYTVMLRNTRPELTPVKIFGASRVNGRKNFGLPAHIEIRGDESTYEEMLMQSESSPFVVPMFRIQSSDAQLQGHDIVISETDARGMTRMTPYNLSPTPMQFQTTISEIAPQSEIIFDGFTEISFDLMGLTDLSIMLFMSKHFVPIDKRPFIASQQMSISTSTLRNILRGDE